MNALRSPILDEVAQLDIKGLIALQSLLPILKAAPAPTNKTVGMGAKKTRQALAGIQGNLAQSIQEEREDRV